MLKGQTALVTGANSGIGKGVAHSLAAAGANVIINYVAGDPQPVVDEIKAKNPNITCIAIQADVSNEQQVIKMFQQAIKELGTIDILVNNAGRSEEHTSELQSH